MQEFLDLLSDEPDAIVVFVDAYDVLFTDGPKAIAKRFLRSGSRILISSEKGCCADWTTTVEAVLKGAPVKCDNTWPVPSEDTVTPYMNSGAFVGYQAYSPPTTHPPTHPHLPPPPLPHAPPRPAHYRLRLSPLLPAGAVPPLLQPPLLPLLLPSLSSPPPRCRRFPPHPAFLSRSRA